MLHPGHMVQSRPLLIPSFPIATLLQVLETHGDKASAVATSKDHNDWEPIHEGIMARTIAFADPSTGAQKCRPKSPMMHVGAC